jgi:hypothetical protein
VSSATVILDRKQRPFDVTTMTPSTVDDHTRASQPAKRGRANQRDETLAYCLSVLPPTGKEPNTLVYLAFADAVILAAGLVPMVSGSSGDQT